MGNLRQFPSRHVDVVTQEELAELKRALYLKVMADANFMRLNLGILERVQAGAVVAGAGIDYHPNLGLVEKG